VFYTDFQIRTVSGRNSFHDISGQLAKVLQDSGITEGILVAATPHTTCSLYYEETMHDLNYFGDEFLQVDISEVMDRIAPRMTTEGQYHSPGPDHIAFGLGLGSREYPSEKWTMLNTDAHLKASLYGSNSLTLIVHEARLQTGSLGKVYFADWDMLRERTRQVQVMVMGDRI
jgi:thiamine phosphate synthase YjbQ (UPF0047 family)